MDKIKKARKEVSVTELKLKAMEHKASKGKKSTLDVFEAELELKDSLTWLGVVSKFRCLDR